MELEEALKWWETLGWNPLKRIILQGELCTKYFGINRITSSLKDEEILKIYLLEK